MRKYYLMLILLASTLFLTGCHSITIRDFEGMSDLPDNPSRIVFGTNVDNFDEKEQIYGQPIEYEIPSENFSEVMSQLFSLKYRSYPKDTEIDLSPVINYLIIDDEDANSWNVNLGLIRHNDLWYYALNPDGLLSLLQEVKVFLRPGTYTTEDGFSSLRLYENNLFTLTRHIAMSYRPNGTYTIDKGKVILTGEGEDEYIFEIYDDYLVFLGSNVPNESMIVGTVYLYDLGEYLDF